jgi:hypothetical protein
MRGCGKAGRKKNYYKINSSGAKGSREGGGWAPPDLHTTHQLTRTLRHCLNPVFTVVVRRKKQMTLTTAAYTVRPAEGKGYSREVPGRTEPGAFSQ